MAKLEPKIHVSMTIGLRDFIRQAGGDFNGMLARAGLSRRALDDPEAMLPANAVACLFEEAARELSEPCLGLKVVERMSHKAISLLGFLIATAPTVRDVLECVAKYACLQLRDSSFTFEERGSLIEASWMFPDSMDAPRTQLSTFFVALFLKRIRLAVGSTWQPLSVDLDHKVLPCPDLVRQCLGERVRFDQRHTRLVMDLSSLSRRLPDRNERLHEVMRQLADRLVSEAKSRTPVADDARRVVIDALSNGRSIDLARAAQALALTPRALQLRLRHVDTTFEQILMEARKAIASHYLQDTMVPLTDIALILGFSELSAFTRAARRWFGVSPRIVRQRALGQR